MFTYTCLCDIVVDYGIWNYPPYQLDPAELQNKAEQINGSIQDQNDRFEMLHEIDDEDFRQLAVDGLTDEQTATLQERDETYAPVDFAALGQELLQNEKTKHNIENVITATSA
jgi:hypothetical protein